MREELKNITNIRQTFIGTFERFGTKSGYMGVERTLLLKNILNLNGKFICDHIWFNLTKGFETLNLQEKDQIQFDARVKIYEKGYKGYRGDIYAPIETDYKLSHPTKLLKIKGK